jgi:hypothetical protein
MNKIVSSGVDSIGTPGIEPTGPRMEMDNGDSLATKPTGEQLQTDEEVIENMKVIEFFRILV